MVPGSRLRQNPTHWNPQRLTDMWCSFVQLSEGEKVGYSVWFKEQHTSRIAVLLIVPPIHFPKSICPSFFLFSVRNTPASTEYLQLVF